MGNGESTSRRISIQRSDEGTIQISENVMLRLSNQKTSKNDNEVSLEPGEIVIHENEVRQMLEKAFQKGQSTAIKKFQAEQEKNSNLTDDEREARHQRELKQLAEYWKEQFEIETVRDSTQDGIILDEEKRLLESEKSKLLEERSAFEEKRKQIDGQLASREKELNDEFSKICEEVDRKIRPLQASTICTSSQTKVLECYRQNKKQPLRCAAEVREFANCVQEARVKLMQQNLLKGT